MRESIEMRVSTWRNAREREQVTSIDEKTHSGCRIFQDVATTHVRTSGRVAGVRVRSRERLWHGTVELESQDGPNAELCIGTLQAGTP